MSITKNIQEDIRMMTTTPIGGRCRRHRSYVWYLVLLLSKYQDISVKRIDLKEKPLNV